MIYTFRNLQPGDVVMTMNDVPAYLVIECSPESNRFGWLNLYRGDAGALYPDLSISKAWDDPVFQMKGKILRGDFVLQSEGYVPEP